MMDVENQRRILIVDDDPTMLRAYTLVLRTGSYRVFEASTGMGGLELVERERPDLVLLDVVLPDVDGLEICRRIKGNAELADVFVVLLSGMKTASEEQAQGLELGADGYIVRPISNRELLARVQAMLRIRDAKVELRERERQHRSVAELGRLALETDDMDVLAERATTAVRETLGATYCAVLELTPLSGKLHLKTSSWKDSPPENISGNGYSIRSVDQHCFDLNGPVLIRDLSQNPSTQPLECLFFGLKAMASVPISVRNTPLGLLVVLDDKVRDFSTSEAVFVGSVANILSSAMERCRIRDLLVRSSKLEATALLGGGIAHDFNNLLGIITANTGFLRLSSALDASLLANVEAIEAAALRAGQLTQRFISMSPQGKPVKKPVFLRDLLRSAASIVLMDSNVRVEYRFPDGEEGDLVVDVDEQQMNQAICCLLLNAREAMPEGGVVRVAACLSEQGLDRLRLMPETKSDRTVCITITDQGKGIPRHQLDRIFDPYFTTKTTLNVKGLGLGLSAAHSIVTRHGGVIEVESEEAAGTLVRIFLPVAKRLPRPLSTPSPTSPSATLRVLVVGEEDAYREMLGKLLSILGYRDVEFARDGGEAIGRFETSLDAARLFDIVIMEAKRGGAWRYGEILSRLRTMQPSLKAILSSTDASDPAMLEPGAARFDGVLVKPYRLEELSEALQALLTP